MNSTRTRFCIGILSLLPLVGQAASSIRITGGKDLVVTIESRDAVLSAGERHLSKESPDFVEKVADLENPFTFEQEVELAPETELARDEPRPAPEPEPEPVRYDDAAILDAISASLARQVRGTMARGNTRYIQLEGGRLLKAGAALPARLPQLEGQTFEVIVVEVTSDGYTLQLNEATRYVPFSDKTRNPGNALMRTPE